VVRSLGRRALPEEIAMTYLIGADLADQPAGLRFHELLAKPGILQMPGTHNGMAALQARDAGFSALYLSGAAMTASMGLPDLGIITMDEVAFFIRQVSRASGLPVLVDGDTGYGEALNVMNMVRTFEEAGAAAVHIEDQLLPKKCGHLNDKKLADARDMAAKVAAAAKARKHLYLIARTDAAASEGMDGAVARAKLYLEAGADAIFPEAMISRDMFEEFAKRVPGVPLLAKDAVLHGIGIRSHGVPDGDLAGIIASRCQQGTAESVRRHQTGRRYPQNGRSHADPRRTLRHDSTSCLRSSGFVDRSDCHPH
jgi:methylisocitrate lyase